MNCILRADVRGSIEAILKELEKLDHRFAAIVGDLPLTVLVVGEPEKHVALMVWGKVRERLHAKEEAHIPLHVLAFVEHAKKAPDGDETLFQ